MKILELRFKNINSLYGEWCIDFTDPDFVANGLFAITGSTGSGKTTILDALCLALYGQTPRLGKMTQSDNEVMSRQTGECFAEVAFETAKGTFSARWDQHRAHKKAGAPLQSPKRELSDATGQILAEKLKEVQEKIDDITGMGFDRFTRSILLAQGSFDSFLKANADERSPLLEQITGTEIYTEISKLVHQRNSTENQMLNELKAGLGGIQLLEVDALEQIQFDLKQIQKKHQEAAKKRDAAKAALDAQARIQALEKELKAASTALPTLGTNLTNAKAAHKATTSQLVNVEAEQEKLRPLLQRVRELDTQIAERKKQDKTARLELQKQRDEWLELNCKKDENEARIEQLKPEQAEAEKYQEEHAQDAQLVGQLAALLQTLEQIKTLSTKKSAAEKAAKRALKTAQQEKEKWSTAKKKRSVAETQLSQIEDEQKTALAGKPLPEWRTQLEELTRRIELEQNRKETRLALKEKRTEALEAKQKVATQKKQQDGLLREQSLLQKNLLLQQKIESLEAERGELIDGQPCPLCGALDHPFASELSAPQPNALEQVNAQLAQLAEEIETLSKQHAAAQARTETLQQTLEKDKAELQALPSGNPEEVEAITRRIQTLEQLEKKHAGAKTAHDEARETVYQLNTDAAEEKAESAKAKWAEIKTEWTETEARLLQKIQPYGVTLATAKTELSKRKERWEKSIQQAAEIQQSLATLATTLTSQTEQIGNHKTRIQQQAKGIEIAGLEIEKLTADRRACFDDRQPDTVEAENQAALAAAKEAHAKTQQQFNESQQAIAVLREKIQTLEKQLQTEREKEQIKTSPEEYEALLISCDALKEQVGNLKSQLEANQKAEVLHADKLREIEKQQMECTRWNQLHELIGSADGKKFRNFAQGLTFELMVSHANRQLEKMSDRYLLIRDLANPLDLNVVDNYQAGEIRPVKNLSGGESFVVSLSLALGLSRMASKNIRVDSLFLDEGFGTLDEEALETALEALAELKQDGKLIGVISHVGALKERIGTQINVHTTHGGRSRLSGSGITAPQKTTPVS